MTTPKNTQLNIRNRLKAAIKGQKERAEFEKEYQTAVENTKLIYWLVNKGK